MKTSFPYEAKPSAIFKIVKRPIAFVDVWSNRFQRFITYSFIVDTGADYTLFPKVVAQDLGVDFIKDCHRYESKGIGGRERVFLLRKKLLVMLGKTKRQIPVGFLQHDDIPPLLGRQECLDTFDVLFSNFTTTFSQNK